MVKWIDSLNESLLKTAEWTGKNFKPVASVLAVILVIGAVWVGIQHKKQSRAAQALISYAPIEKDFTTWKTPAAATKPSQKPDEKKPETKIDPAQLFSRMMDYIKSHSDVPANELMALMASEVAAQLGPAQEAELLEVTKKTFKNGAQLMDGLLLIKNGDLFANQDKCEQALDQWKSLLANKRLSYLHDVARIKSGLCLEKMAQFKEAEMHYDQVIKGIETKTDAQNKTQMMRQNQWAVKEAQKLKRALKWTQKQPSS